MYNEEEITAGWRSVTKPAGHAVAGAEDRTAVLFSDNISDYSDTSVDSPIVPGSAVWSKNACVKLGDAKGGLNTLLAHMKEFWSKHKAAQLPTVPGFKPGYSGPVMLTSYGMKVSCVAIIAATCAVVHYLHKKGPYEGLANVKVVFHDTTPIGIKACAIVVVVMLVAYLACALVFRIYENKERKSRDRLLLSMYKAAKAHEELGPLMDYKLLMVANILRQSCESTAIRISYLEENDSGRAALMDAVERIQLRHKEDMDELRTHMRATLTLLDGAIQDVAEKAQQDSKAAVETMYREITSLEHHVKACERHFKTASEEVQRSVEYQTDVIRGVLQRGLEATTKKAEELQDTVASFNVNMAFVIKSNVYDTRRQVEHLLQVHLESMNFVSTLFSKEDMAAVAVCVFMQKACDNMKAVHSLHMRHVYDSMKSELEYQVPGIFKGLFRETRTINETIVSVYSLLSVEIEPIHGLAYELAEALTDGKVSNEHRDTCSEIVSSCQEKLFGAQGLLKGEMYEHFCKKLCAVLLEGDNGAKRNIAAGPKNDEALQRIRHCAPFLMTLPHIINISKGVEGMHKTADDIYKVCKDVEKSLDSAFGFLPKKYSVSSSMTDTSIDGLQDKNIECA